jgi:hypothetical protein
LFLSGSGLLNPIHIPRRKITKVCLQLPWSKQIERGGRKKRERGVNRKKRKVEKEAMKKKEDTC